MEFLNFPSFLLNDWLIDSLTPLLMPSDKHNLITTIATALISSLFNVVSSGDVSFHQPRQLRCLHHGSTKAYLCSPLYSIPFSFTVQVTICGTFVMASVRDLGKCSASKVRFLRYCLLGMLARHSKSWKRNEARKDTLCKGDTSTFISIIGECALTITHSVFSVMAGLIVEMLFMQFSVYNTA